MLSRKSRIYQSLSKIEYAQIVTLNVRLTPVPLSHLLSERCSVHYLPLSPPQHLTGLH